MIVTSFFCLIVAGKLDQEIVRHNFVIFFRQKGTESETRSPDNTVQAPVPHMSIIQEMAHRPQNENSNRSPLQPRLHLSTSQTLDEADIRWMTLPWPESDQESLHRLDHFFHLRYLQLLHKNFPLSDE
jgi:hypothetical protein